MDCVNRWSKKVLIRSVVVVAVSPLISMGCGGKPTPTQTSYFPQEPITVPIESRGVNCRAFPNKGNTQMPYRSTYFEVFSDGSEIVQTEVDTATPCP